MITMDRELELLFEACPPFGEVWGNRVLGRWSGSKRFPAPAITFAVYAGHVIATRQLDLVRPIFEVVERLLLEGDERVKDHVVCFFLEGLPQELKKRGVAFSTIEGWLGAETTYWVEFLKVALPEVMSD